MAKTPHAVFSWMLVSMLVALGACKNDGNPPPPDFSYHEGDIIFQSLPRNQLVDAIEGVTKSPWSHCGVIMKKNDEWVVYESLDTVRRTPLSKWIARGRNNGACEIYRLTPSISVDVEKLRTQLSSMFGKPYDYHYAPDDAEIYCSELVYKAYDHAQGIKLGTWQTLGSLDWKSFEPFILTIEDRVPLERPMITPVALTRSDLLHRVFPTTATVR